MNRSIILNNQVSGNRTIDLDLNATLLDINRTQVAKKDLIKKISILNMRRSLNTNLKLMNNFKNRISKFIPLKYDIELRPTKTAAPQREEDIRIIESIKLFCNSSTNIILLNTKEFQTIELSLKKLNKSLLKENEIKKWNYELSSNILEIETKNMCTVGESYLLNINIQYKTYGTKFSYDKTPKNVKNYYLLSFDRYSNRKLDQPFPIMIESFDINTQTGKYETVLAGPSVFNLTLVKPKTSFRTMIFNSDLHKRYTCLSMPIIC